jgi:hypothetical protein
MAVLKKGYWKAPFFGKRNDYSTGRDSLGLQTTSQASYSTLLPGLTNLTNRIRYYGFYCWLLETYAKEIGDTNPKVQNKFIRRGEYQIALLMQLHEKDTTQIPGSLFAADEISKKESESEFSLKFGADIEKDKSTYWKYSSGAFGQYYSGALQTIGLIIHREDSPVFVCTQHEDDSIVTGTVLAQAFDENISDSAKQLFLSNIENGFLKKSDSEKLYNALSITAIPRDSDEWELYTKLLFSNDQPLFQNADNQTFFRKDSMLTVLSYINKNKTTDNWDFFTCKLYEQKGKDFSNEESKSSFGWYYYQLNEYWHFGVETIFWSILETLSSKYFQVEFTVFLNEFDKTFVDSLLKFSFIENESQKLNEIIDAIEDVDIWELSEQIRESIKVSDISQCLFLGFKILLSIYKQNEKEFDKLKSFAAFHGMERDGDCINGLNDFTYRLNEPISDVLEKFVLKNIINRHLEVAYRKMGAGTKNTLKFSFEDNFLKHVETISPVWTTPRIYAMYNFFYDLGYVNKENKISQIGEQIIGV